MDAQILFMDSDSVFACAIKAITWSNWSHVGIVYGDQIIDSRYRDGGVTVQSYLTRVDQYKRMELVTLPLPADTIWSTAVSQLRKPYDVSAIIGIPFHRDWQEDDKWFCSELVAWAFGEAGFPIIGKKYGRVTPQDVYEAVKHRQL